MIDLIVEEFIKVGELSYFLVTNNTGWTLLFWPLLLIEFPRYMVYNLIVIRSVFFAKKNIKFDKQELLRNQPLVSIILPALNEEDTISKTIDSILEQSYKNIEVIVVNDGSSDRTSERCLAYEKTHKVRLVKNRVRQGKSSGINYGLKFCKGEYVVTIDADSSFDRDSILNLIAPFGDSNVGAVSGNVRVKNAKDNLLTIFQAMEYQICVSLGRRFNDIANTLYIISGTLGAFRKSILDGVGGMDVGPGEDLDLAIKVRALHKKIAFAPDAICLTNVPDAIRSYTKQRLRWYRDTIKFVLRKHANIFNPRRKNFSYLNLLGSCDIVFFEIILGFTAILYMIYLSYLYWEIMFTVFLFHAMLYIVLNVFTVFTAWLVSERKREDLHFFIYSPIYALYTYFHRFVRLWAYINEFLFRRSYDDTFIPNQVGKETFKW